MSIEETHSYAGYDFEDRNAIVGNQSTYFIYDFSGGTLNFTVDTNNHESVLTNTTNQTRGKCIAGVRDGSIALITDLKAKSLSPVARYPLGRLGSHSARV